MYAQETESDIIPFFIAILQSFTKEMFWGRWKRSLAKEFIS